MSATEAGSEFGGSGGSGVDTGGGPVVVASSTPSSPAREVIAGSEFGGSGGSALGVGGGAAGEQPGATSFDSLATWNALTHTLGRRGPVHLNAAVHFRSAVNQQLRRLPVLG